MNRPIKFRGREFFGKRHVYGQTIRETDDGFDFWDGNDWLHCTNVAQLVGYDADGNEVYEGDTIVNPRDGTRFKAAMNHIYTVKIYVKEATT